VTVKKRRETLCFEGERPASHMLESWSGETLPRATDAEIASFDSLSKPSTNVNCLSFAFENDLDRQPHTENVQVVFLAIIARWRELPHLWAH